MEPVSVGEVITSLPKAVIECGTAYYEMKEAKGRFRALQHEEELDRIGLEITKLRGQSRTGQTGWYLPRSTELAALVTSMPEEDPDLIEEWLLLDEQERRRTTTGCGWKGSARWHS